MKGLMTLCWGLMPSSRLKGIIGRLLGHSIDPTATFHPCIVIGVARFSLGSGARVGPFNVIRDLRRFELASGARLGQWNWVSSAPDFWILAAKEAEVGVLEVGHNASITSRHYLDCSGGILVREMATVAGVRSTFITHGINVNSSHQECSPIVIGAYSLVSSSCKLVPGAIVPEYSVVAMGAVVSKGLSVSYSLYGGVPAKQIRKIDREALYFNRDAGRVVVKN